MESGCAPVGLSWLWEGLVSGVAIVAALGAFGLVRSKWRQHEQIDHLRALVIDTYERMIGFEHGSQRRREFLLLVKTLDVLLERRMPDLSYKKARDLNRVLAGVGVHGDFSGLGNHTGMDLYDHLFFQQVEAFPWLRLDLESIRGQASN